MAIVRRCQKFWENTLHYYKKEQSTDNQLLSFESLQSFHNAKAYLKPDPKPYSGNTSRKNNLYEKEKKKIIRTTSKILSETGKISRWRTERMT